MEIFFFLGLLLGVKGVEVEHDDEVENYEQDDGYMSD